MSKLTTQLTDLVAGCFTGIWIESQEPSEALREIAMLCRQNEWQLANWNIDQGLQAAGQSASEDAADPLAAIKAAQAMGDSGTSLLVLENFHRFLSSPELIQAMVTALHSGKQTRSIVVVLAPLVDRPRRNIIRSNRQTETGEE